MQGIRRGRRGRRFRGGGFADPLPLLPLLILGCGGGGEAVVCSKNFTESVLLGEIVAQQLERHQIPVRRKLNLGGTVVCHRALVAGDVDAYVEYTGTAHSAILGLTPERDPGVVYRTVDSIYRSRWDLQWTEPLGFDNTFAMLVRGETAERHGLETLSDAVPYAREWRPGFGYEFMERADGFSGLVETYGLTFGSRPAVMDLGLTYRALAEGQVDVIAGNSTDGQIAALGLVHLMDDRRYFPPYEAAPIVRRDALERFPALRDALAALGGTIDEEAMRRMNFLVDVERRDVTDVAREFLARTTGSGGGEGGED